jgi:hypothetical protein
MINVRELITDPDFSQKFTVYRSSGEFVNGRWVETHTEVSMVGVIIPASAKELNMLPEADRVVGTISIYTKTPLYITSNDRQGTSDKILWKGDLWKLISVNNYSDFGFYKGIAQRMAGD